MNKNGTEKNLDIGYWPLVIQNKQGAIMLTIQDTDHNVYTVSRFINQQLLNFTLNNIVPILLQKMRWIF